MTRPLFEDLLARSLAQIPEMETRILADEVVRLRAELATAREVLVESLEARRVTDAKGGALNQANNEIDRLRARVAELEAVGTGRVRHIGNGICPDAIEGYDVRDPECPACRALGSATAYQWESPPPPVEVAWVPVRELATLRKIVRLLDEARQRYARMPRAGASTSMGDEIDELLNQLYEMGAHPADARPTW